MPRITTIEKWIEEALADSDKDKPCSAIACFHVQTSGGHKPVHTVPLKGKTWEASSIAKLLIGRAETTAQNMGGIQVFELKAYYGKDEPEAFHTFRVVDGELQTGYKAPKESSDAAGLVQQTMRHLERSQEIMLSITQQFAISAAAREERYATREAQLQAEVNDAYVILRDVLMGQVKESHAMQMERLKYMRETYERRDFFKKLPGLVNTATGREVFPQSDVNTTIVEGLLESLDENKLDMLIQSGMIPEKLKVPILTRFAEMKEEKRLEEEELKKIKASSENPEDDATGGKIVDISRDIPKKLKGGNKT